MLDRARIEELRAGMHGGVVRPGDATYDDARRVYNAMIDRHPAVIANCADVSDVIAAVNFGVAEDLPIAVRAGGHNAGGLGVCDGGVVIDLKRMHRIAIDPDRRVARIDAGCLLRDVDAATNAFGLAVPTGILSTTGLAGLLLGGGTGHLTRKFGLTIDSLIGADVVLSDGELVYASEDENEELFWGIRGGGGNFGVVTSFELELHPLDMIVGGPTLWPMDRAFDVMQWYREMILQAPEDLNGFFAFMTVPPAPVFPTELHGKKMCAIVWCWTGPLEAASAAFAPVHQMQPALFGVQPMAFPTLQSMFDALYPPGLQWYWRADFIESIHDAAIDVHLDFAEQMPTPLSSMHLYPTDGAAQRVPNDATAYSYRDANWNQVIVGVDPDPANRARITQWTRDYWEALHPYSLGGAYVNFLMDDEGPDRTRGAYRGNHERLVAVKRQYDPDNRFRINKNIDPNPQHAPTTVPHFHPTTPR